MSEMKFWSLTGLIAYDDASALQRRMVELRAAGEIQDTVLLLEHEPVITRGRGLQFTGEVRERAMPLLAPLPSQIAFCESERGGDLTYHGPGQLVIYPICKLDGLGFGPHHDVTGFLRNFEQVLIGVLSKSGLAGESHESATGVWVGARKVASIGVAVRKWVTYHGAAINIVNSLEPFQLISPCGFAPEVMTNLRELVKGASQPEGEGAVGEVWRENFELLLMREFQSALGTSETPRIERLTLDDARSLVGI